MKEQTGFSKYGGLPDPKRHFIMDADMILEPRSGQCARDSVETAKANFVKTIKKSRRRVKKIIKQRIVRETAPHRAQAVLDVEIT